MSKRTPWYPIRVKPVRVGWYEYKYDELIGFTEARWDGHAWHFEDDSVLIPLLGDKWRGLTRPAERD